MDVMPYIWTYVGRELGREFEPWVWGVGVGWGYALLLRILAKPVSGLEHGSIFTFLSNSEM